MALRRERDVSRIAPRSRQPSLAALMWTTRDQGQIRRSSLRFVALYWHFEYWRQCWFATTIDSVLPDNSLRHLPRNDLSSASRNFGQFDPLVKPTKKRIASRLSARNPPSTIQEVINYQLR